MKKIFLLLIFIWGIISSSAQINTTITINSLQDRKSISPLIYGSNGQSADEDENITARRLGGNRLTGYNWENNASNAGNDWNHSSDDYLPWASGLPMNTYLIPNIVYQAFHDTSLSMNCYSLITIPMAGYVAKDFDGTVQVSETAPSSRFCNVINRKGSAFSIIPDTTDQDIYIDECLNNLIQQNGLSNSTNGIRGYSMDNEYALWNSTHPRIHPVQPEVGEVISRSINLASTIKAMDPNAEVFGPADYGFASFLNFQSATDWSNYMSYGNFINAYLKGMKLASDSVGYNLLDVLDVHWYPEALGMNDQGQMIRVTEPSNDRGVAEARMQCPRSLWDSTYTENSWIGQWFSPCVYILQLMNGIDNYFPSAKLAFTEFDYGGSNHISGGIAQTDVLGIFGKYGLYMSNHWGALDDFVSTAYKIYRNYDGNNSTFGDINVFSSTSDSLNTSIYSSIENSDSTRLHFILINKNYDSTLTATIDIVSPEVYSSAEVWRFDSSSTSIVQQASISNITGNQFQLTMPPLTVYHLIVQTSATTEVGSQVLFDRVTISPNPATEKLVIRNLPFGVKSISIENSLSQIVFSSFTDESTKEINVSNLNHGIYFLKIQNNASIQFRKFIKE